MLRGRRWHGWENGGAARCPLTCCPASRAGVNRITQELRGAGDHLVVVGAEALVGDVAVRQALVGLRRVGTLRPAHAQPVAVHRHERAIGHPLLYTAEQRAVAVEEVEEEAAGDTLVAVHERMVLDDEI